MYLDGISSLKTFENIISKINSDESSSSGTKNIKYPHSDIGGKLPNEDMPLITEWRY